MRNRMTSAPRFGIYYHPQRRADHIQRGIVEIQRAAGSLQRKQFLVLAKANLARCTKSQQAVRVPLTKRIADLFTLLRLALGLGLISSGVVDGTANLAQDIWMLVMAWSTDMVDGRISRSMNTNGKTWLGKHDVYVDMFVSIAVLIYLAVTSLLPLWLMFAYLLVWGALILKWGLPPIFAQIFQNPIYAYFLVVTMLKAPWVLPWLLLWGLVALIFFWRRLAELLKSVWATVFRQANRRNG